MIDVRLSCASSIFFGGENNILIKNDGVYEALLESLRFQIFIQFLLKTQTKGYILNARKTN